MHYYYYFYYLLLESHIANSKISPIKGRVGSCTILRSQILVGHLV